MWARVLQVSNNRVFNGVKQLLFVAVAVKAEKSDGELCESAASEQRAELELLSSCPAAVCVTEQRSVM